LAWKSAVPIVVIGVWVTTATIKIIEVSFGIGVYAPWFDAPALFAASRALY